MSAGNPFRASIHQKPTTSARPLSFHNADSKISNTGALELKLHGSDSVHALSLSSSPPSQQQQQQFPAKTKKSVRIESPASSPPYAASSFPNLNAEDDLQHRIDQRRLAAPPPLSSPAGFSDNFEDYAPDHTFGRDAQKRDGDDHGDRGVTASARSNSDVVEPVLPPSGAPINPFSRTLATIGSQEKGSTETAHTPGQNRDRMIAADKTVPGNMKPSLDVEGFKKLLMTGISNPPGSGQTSQPAPATAPTPINASLFESSSSTDTSSISRQSIFEPVQELHIETPRTSYEMAASDDDEMIGLVGDTDKKKAEKKKPPPPRPRHGKPVAPRAPQIVSFSDFSTIQPTSSLVSRNRTDSDLNKPLPPPPVLSPTAHVFLQNKTQDEPPPLETTTSGSSGQSDITPVQKRVPPPVPIARRQSQLRSSTTGNRSRSSSSITMSSQHSTDLPILSPALVNEPTSSPASHKTPPPPPPVRRYGASITGGTNTPSTNSSTTELPLTASSRRPPISSPNPPTSRRPTISSPPPSPIPTRTPSFSSTFNRRTVSNESATMAPPPPPPRRSGRNSLDKERPYPLPTTSPTDSRRTSSENKRSSFDGKRRTSVASESSLRREYARASENEHALYSPVEEEIEESRVLRLQHITSGSSNILDDMEKFQREIDELRAKFKPVR
ncbi:hypothetical protein K504DRAFT_213600 [Pleomassaria siparia CBS 279.74]|uniref:Uncharacterized protein n=1 Tax=Pleomassaria siparia CBS 279.74 TaxID=1314801 RepID=A0A6G1JQY3_9PLEO|nr:hypothetical protein K504DRAFT_213600 [Pleomassaria siparia CBS 279.74]